MNISLNAEPGSILVVGKPEAPTSTSYALSANPGTVSIFGNTPVDIDAIIEVNQWPDSRISSFVDFSEQVADLVSYWKLEAEVDGDFVTLPMQYFRATMWNYRDGLPSGGTNYVELSIPNALENAEAINNADSFRVKRFFLMPNGVTFGYVFFNFGYYDDQEEEFQFHTGRNENSCIIKSAFRLEEAINTDQYATRTLRGIRNSSVTADGIKVTCNFDPNILPGMTVDFNGDEFVAETIGYFVSPTDQYIEVHSYSV